MHRCARSGRSRTAAAVACATGNAPIAVSDTCAKPSFRSAEGNRRRSHALNSVAKDGATLAATAPPAAINRAARSTSSRNDFAPCGHSRTHVPHAMQRSSTTNACPSRIRIAFTGHIRTHR